MNPQPVQSPTDNGNRLVQFEAEWSSGRIPQVSRYLREAGPNDSEYIADLIEIDLEWRWKQFQSDSDPSARDPHGFPIFPLMDDYASVLPESLQNLIYNPHCFAEEYRVRSRWGDKPAKESFLERCPSDRAEIEAALRRIDTDFENEGISASEQSSQSVAAEGEATFILGQPANADATLVSEAKLIGTTIGKYQLEWRLGNGAFGEVWKAYDPDLERHVAIKIPRRDKHFPKEMLETFRAEARKLAALEHIPHGIVNVYDCGEHEGRPYFVSKLIDGESLASRIHRERLSHREAAQLIAKVAEILKQAHQTKLVHRDIKPGNILLDQHGEPCLADFGMAATEEERLNEKGSILGTFVYMSPEQARGDSHRADGRADIYALGVVLYRLLTQELPYSGKTTEQYLENVQHQKPRPPRQIDETIPPALERICLKCLEKDENQRYSSAGELARELRQSVGRDSGHRKRILLAAAAFPLFLFFFGLAAMKFHDWAFAREAWTEPEVLVWAPYDDRKDHYRFDPTDRKFKFDAFGTSLFKVGESDTDELRLKARFSINSADEVGQAGVFWAFAPVVGDKDIIDCCWDVQVGRLEKSSPVVLRVRQHNFRLRVGHREVARKDLVFERYLINEPGSHYQLEVRVTRFEIVGIAINGQEILKDNLPLRQPPIDGREWNKLKDTDYGMIGIGNSIAFEDFSAE